MAKFILCWHKMRTVEEVEASRIDSKWLQSIACSDLDVLKIKDGKPYILDSAAGWTRVKSAKPE